MKISTTTPLTYQAGAHISEIEKKFGLKGVIKLASNENPLGPSPLVFEALRSISNLHRYPDERNTELRDVISQKFQIEVNRILIANGTTQLIDIIIRSFCLPTDEILLFEKSFIYYRISAQNHHIPYSQVEREDDFAYNVDTLISKIKNNTKVIFLAAPDNPTGVYISKKEVEKILEALPEQSILVLDEAYREYVPLEIYFDPITIGDPRLVILRTFSKIYGLAGLRCGYAIAEPSLISLLTQIQAPFSVSVVAQAAAIAAIDDQSHIEFSKTSNRLVLEEIKKTLSQNNIKYIPSNGNFIMINTGRFDGENVCNELMSAGVIARSLKMYGLNNFIRVTAGLVDENQKFISNLLKIIGN